MAKNPFLKVFVVCGYYDMATYVGGAEFNFSHLAYDRQITDRVSFGYYEAGHMMYIRPSAHKALKQDVAKFIRSASGPTRAPRRPQTPSEDTDSVRHQDSGLGDSDRRTDHACGRGVDERRARTARRRAARRSLPECADDLEQTVRAASSSRGGSGHCSRMMQPAKPRRTRRSARALTPPGRSPPVP